MVNKQRLDELVENLGMKNEIAPLLDFEDGYPRLERAIQKCLNHYDGKTFAIVINKRGFSKPYELRKLDVSISIFRRYYGIGQNAESIFDIWMDVYGDLYYTKAELQKRNCNKEEIQWMKERMKERGKYMSRGELVSQKIHGVLDLLRQKHKAEIWYGTLG